MKLRTIILGLLLFVSSACICSGSRGVRAPDSSETFVVRSTDGGVTFLAPTNLFPNATYANATRVVIEGNNVLVVWEGSPYGGSIFISRSTDSGATFGTPLNISNNPERSFSPNIAIKGNAVLVSWGEWVDSTYRDSNLFVVRSTDGGVTFGVPIKIDINSRPAFNYQIAIDGSIALILWHSPNFNNMSAGIFVVRSTDGGATFTAPVQLSSNTGDFAASKIMIEGNTVLAAWEQLKDPTPDKKNIFIAHSTDGGANFSSPRSIFINTGNFYLTDVALSGSTVLVTWTDNSTGNNGVFVARSTDTGMTFTTPVNVSSNSGYPYTSWITIQGSTALVVWQDDSLDNSVIFIARSVDNGATFSTPVKIANKVGYYSRPEVVLSGSIALVIWNNRIPGKYSGGGDCPWWS